MQCYGSRKVERSIRPENSLVGAASQLFRYGVVGNMSGSHPVASGSIPGIGLSIEKFLVLLAQLAEHPLNILAFLAQSAERCANNFSLVLGSRERFVWKRNGRRFDPGRKLLFFVYAPVV